MDSGPLRYYADGLDELVSAYIGSPVRDPEDFAAVALDILVGLPMERLLVLKLRENDDQVGHRIVHAFLLGCPLTASGSWLQIDSAALFRLCHPGGPSNSLFFAHNHPNGNPKFSPHDVAFTRKMLCFVQRAGMQFMDHMLVAGGNIYSARAAGYVDEWAETGLPRRPVKCSTPPELGIH